VLAHIIALIVKELLAVLRDPRSRFVLIGPPIIQVMVFGYAASFDLNQAPIGVYDEDNSHRSRELVAAFTGSPAFTVAAELRADREVAEIIDRREALLVLHLPANFESALERSGTASIQLIVDGRNSNTAMIALNYARQIVMDVNDRWSAERGMTTPARLQLRARYNPNLQSRWFIVPGIVGLLTLVVAMVVTSLSVAREREFGTFDQLLVTPLTPFEILIGKAVPGFLIGTVEASFIVLVALFWFDIPLQGSLLALYLGLWVFLLSAVGVGLMLSSLAVTQQQALLGAFMFLVPAVILSGFATPIANMSPAVQYLTFLNPLRYFMVVLRAVFLEGATPAALWPQYWPMAAIGLVSMSCAAWLFRRRLY